MNNEEYTHIMDVLEVIHEENVFIVQLLASIANANEHDKHELIQEMDKRFDDVRKHWY